MMKKILSILLTSAMLLSIAGCNMPEPAALDESTTEAVTEEATQTAESTTTAAATTTPAENDDSVSLGGGNVSISIDDDTSATTTTATTTAATTTTVHEEEYDASRYLLGKTYYNTCTPPYTESELYYIRYYFDVIGEPYPPEVAADPAEDAPVVTTTATQQTTDPDDNECTEDVHNVYALWGETVCPMCGETLSASEAIVTTTTAATTTTTEPETTATTTPVETTIVSEDIISIMQVCGLKSNVETDIYPCAVDVHNEHNPYDVFYDYGICYNLYVYACDWDLVFDADYYIEQFPMLATLYHNNKELLLEHFQTVGIHEGRQGCAEFNVGAYKNNCDADIRDAFGDNYEGYYFYYMLNYQTEKSVKTSGDGYAIQYRHIMTKCQADELAGVNMYRAEVGVADIAFESELAAMANYRAWVNAHDGWRGHKWTYESENYNFIKEFAERYDANSFGENTAYYLNTCRPYGDTSYETYRSSTDGHYEAMINANYDLIGLSNVYYSWSDTFTNHFQTFLNLK